MAGRADPINRTQLEVLRWVDGGCPDGVMTGSSYKLTAQALAWRGLVAVSKKQGIWRAEITEAGRYYLQHGRYPDGHGERKPLQQKTTRSKVRGEQGISDGPSGTNATKLPPTDGERPVTAHRAPPDTTARITAERRTAARKLVENLIANEELVIHQPDESEVARWRKVVDFAKRHKMVPEGQRLEKQRMYGGDLRIRLLKGVHFNSAAAAESTPTAVLDSIDQCHPLLADLRDPSSVFDVSESLVPRVLRFLHVLLTECADRRFNLSWSRDVKDGIRIEMEGLEYRVTVAEETEKRDVLPSAEELSGRKTYVWQRVQAESRTVPNGRLVVSLFHGRWTHRKWADRKRWTIEDKIPAMLAELEERVAEERERRAAAERYEREQQRERDAAIERATSRFHEDRRITALEAQLADWGKAAMIREFCDACEGSSMAGRDAARTAAWLAWCRDYADRIDPAMQGVAAPEEVEPNSKDLQPYLPRHMRTYTPGASGGFPAAGYAGEFPAGYPVPSQWHPRRNFWHRGAR
ncbi:hypothetical protein [Nocardia crassostreae]|uniref:hypothetical protein n=1 Tax=Nocardia crassostreae TaxID=53428 RepID=UPI000A4DE78C|nr:hypothetical protein [Nocardia crassostreae]